MLSNNKIKVNAIIAFSIKLPIRAKFFKYFDAWSSNVVTQIIHYHFFKEKKRYHSKSN